MGTRFNMKCCVAVEFVNPRLQQTPVREESMSKQLTLSAQISTALMAVLVIALAMGGPTVDAPAETLSGNAPLIGLSIGR